MECDRDLCIACSRDCARTRCPTCLSVAYCSTACRFTDWRGVHELECALYLAQAYESEDEDDESLDAVDLDDAAIYDDLCTSDELNAWLDYFANETVNAKVTRKRHRRSKRSSGLSRRKARKILRHGSVRGHKLTSRQKRFFGAIAGGQRPRRRA